MKHVSRSAGRPADDSAGSSVARPAQHPAIIRPYMTGDAYAECLSTDAVEAFFQQCPATELIGPEVGLLNSLIRVAEALQAVLPRCVTLQEWAHRISSAPQLAFDSSAAQPASVVEEFEPNI